MKFTSYYKNKTVELGKKLGSGGEGDVYEMKGNDAVVVKLYNDHCKTNERFEKLKRIIEKKIPYKETVKKRLAMPLDILMDDSSLFVGYVMLKVTGETVKTTIFSKKKIATSYPYLTRKDLAKLCMHFLDQIEYLHSKNILIGDINPQNLLLDKKDPKICWVIDTDSFQADELPCPVGTDAFAPPRLQGVNFKDVLRNKEDEYFSMAIMLFMILMTGKHPYSQIGGESTASNIRSKKFPYKIGGKMEDVPVGYWQYIWSYFTKRLKQAFINVFANEKVITPKEWKDILNGYIYAIDNGYASNLVYPLSFRPYGNDIISVSCEDCGGSFEVNANWDKRLRQSGKNHKCGFCMQKVHATILAKKTEERNKKISIKKKEDKIYTKPSSMKITTTISGSSNKQSNTNLNTKAKSSNSTQNKNNRKNNYKVKKNEGLISKIFKAIFS